MGTGPGGAGYKKDPAPVRSTQGQDRCRFCGATLFALRRGLDARRKSPSRRANTLPSCNGDPRPKLLGAAGRGCRGLAPCLPAEVFAPCLLPFLPGPGPFARPSAAHNSCAHRPFPSYRALLGCGIAASLPPHRFTALYTHPRRKVKIRNFILWLREVRGVHEARHPIALCRHKKRGRISAAPHGMDIWQAYPSPASLGSPLSIPAACGRYELYHLKCPSYPMLLYHPRPGRATAGGLFGASPARCRRSGPHLPAFRALSVSA